MIHELCHKQWKSSVFFFAIVFHLLTRCCFWDDLGNRQLDTLFFLNLPLFFQHGLYLPPIQFSCSILCCLSTIFQHWKIGVHSYSYSSQPKLKLNERTNFFLQNMKSSLWFWSLALSDNYFFFSFPTSGFLRSFSLEYGLYLSPIQFSCSILCCLSTIFLRWNIGVHSYPYSWKIVCGFSHWQFSDSFSFLFLQVVFFVPLVWQQHAKKHVLLN